MATLFEKALQNGIKLNLFLLKAQDSGIRRCIDLIQGKLLCPCGTTHRSPDTSRFRRKGITPLRRILKSR